MNIIVSGGYGFIGANFVKLLNKRFPQELITVIDKLTYSANPDYIRDIPHNSFTADMNTMVLEEWNRFLIDVDYIVNFAAESHVDRSIIDSDPFISSNINGTYNLLKMTKMLAPRARFVQISTDEVYGSVRYNPVDENAILNPTSPYASSKAAADHLVMAYHKTFGLDTVITRSGNNYGPNQHREKFVPAAITNLLNRKPATVYGRGEEQRQWIHVEDNCEGILEAMRKGKSGAVYNIGTLDRPMKNIDMLSEISSYIYPDDDPLVWANFVPDPRPGHDYKYYMSCSKAASELNWEPRLSFKYGLVQTIKWYHAKKDS